MTQEPTSARTDERSTQASLFPSFSVAVHIVTVALVGLIAFLPVCAWTGGRGRLGTVRVRGVRWGPVVVADVSGRGRGLVLLRSLVLGVLAGTSLKGMKWDSIYGRDIAAVLLTGGRSTILSRHVPGTRGPVLMCVPGTYGRMLVLRMGNVAWT